MLSHRIRPVSEILAPHAEYLWMVRGYLPTRWRNMILPDGAMELMINLGDPQKLCAPDNPAKHTIFRQSWISSERTTTITFYACTSSGETARASSSMVSSPAAAVSCGRNPIVAFLSIAIVPLSGETSPRRSANKVDLPAPLGPTNPIRSPRLTWSDTSSKSARPAKDFEN